MSERVPDFALIIGHVWRCMNCRDALLADPATVWLGFKLSDEQRARIRDLDDESFQTMDRLAAATGLTAKELEAAIEHPRARLRHLGSVKGNYFERLNSGR